MLNALRAASAGRQLALIAAAAAMLCAVLAGIYFFWLRADYTPLYRDVREADAAAIVAALDADNIPHRLADGGRTILVPASEADAARLRIAGQDLPLQGAAGFELFNGSSIGLTEFAQRINLQRALQGELARTIMRIDGVNAARVHLSMGEPSVFRGDRRPPRASVSVTMKEGRALRAGTVRGIQRLVAGAVPELDLASVAVLNERGAVVSGDAPPEAGGGEVTAEARSVQRFFETRIRRALEARYPADALEVTIWAALDEPRRASRAYSFSSGTAETGRDFRLRVTVAIAASLSEAAEVEATRAVHEAIGFDERLGDSVTVTASAPPLPGGEWAADAPDTVSPARRTPATAGEPSIQPPLWLPLGLALLVVFLLAARRRTRSGPMSEPQRLAFATNLKALLAEREPDAAPRS